MSDEFGNWSDLARLWHTHTTAVSAPDVKRHAARQRLQMQGLAMAEAVCLVLSYIAAVWIAMQTTMVALTAIVLVFVGVCAFLQHRLRREPPPDGGVDLLSSLDHSIAREQWNLKQFATGRAVTFLTLIGISLLASDHLSAYATTPAPRILALLVIVGLVLATLAVNLGLTRVACSRKRQMEVFAERLRSGPEFRGRDPS